MIVMTMATTAWAQVQAGRLLFPNDSAIVLKIAPRSTITRELCHSGRFPAERIRVRATGFDFLADASAGSDGKVFAPTGLGAEIPAGECEPATIAVASGMTVPKGDHAGQLVITSTAGIARLAVTIKGDAGPAKVVAPVGAVDPAVLRDRRDGTLLSPPWRHDGQGGDGVVPVKKPKAGETYKDPADGDFLGSLWNGDDRARVYARGGFDKARADVWLLPVRFDGAGEVGDYTGKLDLDADATAAADADHLIAAKLTVTDGIWWAIAAVVAGALTAFLAQLWVRRWRAQLWLWTRRYGLPADYTTARKEFAGNGPDYAPKFPGPPESPEEAEGSIAHYRRQIKQAGDAYGKTVFYFDTDSEAYKSIVESLRVVQRDCACLAAKPADPTGLVARLSALEAALASVEQAAQGNLGDCKPAVLAYGKGILAGAPLKVGGAIELADRVKAHTAFALAWVALSGRTLELTYWLALLVQEVPGTASADHALLRSAAVKLAEAEHELITLETADDLADLTSDADLDQARTLLTRVGAKHGVWPEPGAASLAAIEGLTSTPLEQSLMFTERNLWAFRAADDAVPQDVQAAGADREASIDAAAAAGVVQGARSLGDLGVLVWSIALGLLTALNALYFGKTFGTWGDYSAAVIAGAASQLLVAGLAETLGKLRGVDAALIAVTPPKPAGVTVTTATSPPPPAQPAAPGGLPAH
jgi:hypothetical protein